MKFLRFLEQRSKPSLVVMGLVSFLVVGIADYLTGYELTLSLFYLVPIALVAWAGGLAIGSANGAFAVVVNALTDVASGRRYSHPFYFWWNVSTKLVVAMFIVWLVFELRKIVEREREFSGTDYLTGLTNRRVFHDLLQTTVDRARRYRRPFTISLLDLDDFKRINDEHGHDAGDRVLRSVALVLKSCLRNSDVVARLGGDEFAVIFSECGADTGEEVATKLLASVRREMDSNGWPVTVSIGALSSDAGKLAPSELLKEVDRLMYQAKHEGKDSVVHRFEG